MHNSNHCINSINTTYCQPANLIPHFWHYKIVDKNNDPDLPCMFLLSEVFGWFRSLRESKAYYSTGISLPELIDGKLAISYDYLSAKLNFSKERIRKNFIKLETLGIITREVKNIALENGTRINQLYLIIDSKFFESCFRNPEFDIRVGNDQLKPVAEVDNKVTSASIDNSAVFVQSHSLDGEHISKKNNNRSTNTDSINLASTNAISQDSKVKSNFLENSLEEEKTIVMKPQTQPRRLGDFYPLTKEDCNILQANSRREFTLNAMNEILLAMSKKLTQHIFYSKKGFMSYMTKCFQYEKRDAVKISNENFRIKANMNNAEKFKENQEKYLSEIEYNLQVSPEWHLKKKLASVLNRNKAYKLLKAYKSFSREGGVFYLQLTRPVELTEHDKGIILNQARASHEGLEHGQHLPIEKLEIIQPQKATQYKASKKEAIKITKSNIAKTLVMKEAVDKTIPDNIWGKLRIGLIAEYGAEGRAVDHHWFSKLDANINESSRTIKLKAPTEFIKDWVQSNYSQMLELLANRLGYGLEGFSC